MTMKRYKRGSFSGATPTSKSEAADFRAKSIEDLCEIDTYENNSNVFTVRVVTDSKISSDQPLVNSAYTFEGRRIIDSSNAYVQIKFRGQLIDSNVLVPHVLVPDICDLSTTSQNTVEVINYSTMLIDCISPAAYSGEVPMIGDLVKVTLRPGDVGPVDCQTCYFEDIEFLSTSESNSLRRNANQKDCSSLAELVKNASLNGAGAAAGPRPKISWDLADKPETLEFFNKMKNNSAFAGFSDNFLWGLTANAIRESGLVSNIGGDPESMIGKRYYPPVKNFCSFGYWQLQLCSKDAEGSKLIRDYHPLLASMRDEYRAANKPLPETGFPISEEFMFQYITNENVQFAYVAKRMKELFPNDWNSSTITPYEAAYNICVDFERPIHKETKGRERGNLAQSLRTDSTNLANTETA